MIIFAIHIQYATHLQFTLHVLAEMHIKHNKYFHYIYVMVLYFPKLAWMQLYI